MALNTENANASIEALTHISELTGAKVRIFLSEVAEGVSSYRSMHSLTQQVEHQYHGRFLIELIQNAHDALSEHPGSNRIDIVFDPEDSPHGSLLVANDGEPFSPSNFERLSQLGQSDKDPQSSIGNKGIGFRSVLEISSCPEIYSRSSAGSSSFDGYCFAFRPDVVASLSEPILHLAKDGSVPVWPVSGKPIISDWSDEMLAKFRGRVQRKGMDWLKGEARFLSPYLLPVPLARIDSARVTYLESQGFSTVVRLPLKSEEVRNYVLERMQKLSADTVLFLEKIGTLRIASTSQDERTFSRASEDFPQDLGGIRVVVADGGTKRVYGVWSRNLHVASAPDAFRRAVAALPGRWPEITDISVSVAVRLGDKPETGRFSIYLPTLVTTGSAVHINAPFFGDMSRTSIPFDDAYNRQLLEAAVDLSLEVVRSRLAGKGETEACAILDFLAPMGSGAASDRWIELITDAELRASASLCDEHLILAEGDAWTPLNLTSLIPTPTTVILLTEEVLRRHATFNIFHKCFNSRAQQIKDLAGKRFSETGAYPLASDLAATIAAAAAEIKVSRGDWNAFWRDVAALLPEGQAELAEHAVLLGSDGTLHRAGQTTKVFFLPKQGTQDDGDVGSDGPGTEVPASLQRFVAFLSEEIQLYDPNRLTMQTPVRNYLGQGLVSQFRVETIFSEVLQQLLPNLPEPIDGEHSARCCDILGWALRLMGNVVTRRRGADATLKLLQAIPVPCEGGWFPMKEASFSEGWPDTVGSTLKVYLNSLKTTRADAATKRLLLPPSHPAWGDVGAPEMSLLIAGGVLNGLRLIETRPNTWSSDFRASVNEFRLPGPPPCMAKDQWSAFSATARSEVKVPFTTPQPYQVGSVWTFPGMAEFDALDGNARQALSELALQSLPDWAMGLQKLVLSKQGGQWSRLEVTSPLMHFLKSARWLSIKEAKGTTWSRPSERWFVPADTLAGRARHYAHLKALPATMARYIAQSPHRADVLRMLGMQFFDPHTTTNDSSLLEALTAAVGRDDVSDSNVLLGQLRDAWQRFRPPTGHPQMPRLAVRRRDKQLSTIEPTIESPAFVPDSGAYTTELEEFDFPVVTIGPADAKDLRDWFGSAYGARIQLTSALSLVPHVDGMAWTGVGATSLTDSELGWMVRPLLVMAAQGRGLHSAAFKERVETLRAARIDWVPSLSVGVMRGETKLATTQLAAFWEPLRKTLVVTEHCRTHPEELSNALAQALERDDFRVSLRLLLRPLGGVESAPEDLAAFLEPLDISPEQVHQVLEHLRGDIGHMSRLISLLVAVLSPEADLLKLQDASTEEELTSALAILELPGIDIPRTLQIARDSQDTFEFGLAVSSAFGELASLARWNAVLDTLHQPKLINRNWQFQLHAGLEEAAALIKRVIAHAIRQGVVGTYAELYNEYQRLISKVDFGLSKWTVSFNDAMQLTKDLVARWLNDPAVISSVQNAKSAENLREKLSIAGLPLDVDPDECGRRNHALLDTVAQSVDRLRLAAWLRSDPKNTNQDWRPLIDQYRLAGAPDLSRDAFTRDWSEAHVLAILKDGVSHASTPDFEAALASSPDLASLQAACHLSDEDVSSARNRLEAIKAERNRRRSVVKVCGEEFDSSDDNLNQLWAFLSARITDEQLASSMPLNLAKPTILSSVKTRQRTRHDGPTFPSRRAQRQPMAIEELIGLAGEIHVFRMLRQQYGEDAVPASAWVSENSRHVYEFNQCDDGRGCDFQFTAKGKQFRVEVKASAGDDEIFTLGSSEIRLALEIGTKGKRKREIFLLVHVKNALSAQPSAVVLPNPYDPKYAGMFRVEEAGARVRYRTRT
ncbi:sacsin N-terminal ATP-binding-like domain-containing protein [Cupriavidus consociatus]|uniref:sacsin N-terminal ATP-binding-like domain-containing protein n=1 Tax=Cupriavidus consociatus TaxID=2821357 RepID=UPI001AE0F394|nr:MULTISPECIES: ATP-binding protein [unclassified Cupriavidus]MBP0621998.1 ATP-binding protein [Cupriavidus sp. LEh25]MDK2658673.1 ATP-binding protein [Cupriavidus sp. LEh21]